MKGTKMYPLFLFILSSSINLELTLISKNYKAAYVEIPICVDQKTELFFNNGDGWFRTRDSCFSISIKDQTKKELDETEIILIEPDSCVYLAISFFLHSPGERSTYITFELRVGEDTMKLIYHYQIKGKSIIE